MFCTANSILLPLKNKFYNHHLLLICFSELCSLKDDKESSWRGIEEEDEDNGDTKQPLDTISSWKR